MTFSGKNLVDSICKYIMKGQPGKKEYFRWYALAVEQDIRITRLYEYYIETMPRGVSKRVASGDPDVFCI